MPRKKPIAPLHPGELLLEDFMKPAGLSITSLARELRVPATRISQIVNEKRGITADTALRLARYFGTDREFWMHIQVRYDLDVAEDSLNGAVERGVIPKILAA